MNIDKELYIVARYILQNLVFNKEKNLFWKRQSERDLKSHKFLGFPNSTSLCEVGTLKTIKRVQDDAVLVLGRAKDYYQKESPEMFCKKSILKKFAKSTENICARHSFSIKLQALKRVS